MVNGVPREIPRPKPEEPQAPMVLAVGLSEGLHFTMIHSRIFYRFSLFWHPELEYGFLSANGLPRESIGHYTGLGQRILVELNLNILARDA